MNTRSRFLVFSVAAVLAWTAAASAQAPSPAPSAPAPSNPPSSAQDDPMAPYRERFKLGMERYKSGNTGEAIQYWEAIYRELGPQKGYRLSFNLGRAYETVGESTRAAEHYEAFLEAVAARRKDGEPLEPIVVREEDEAKTRLSDLQASKGRIRVTPGEQPVVAQVDLLEPRLGSYVTYVAPGAHVVTFAPGAASAERRTIDVKAGEMVDVAPTPPKPPEPPAAPTPPGPPSPGPSGPRAAPQAGSSTAKERPFSPVVLYVAGGVTLASVVVPILTYENAWSIVHSYDGDTTATAKNAAVSSYGPAKTTAYATLSVPLGLAAVTGGLALWYFLGGKSTEVTAGFAPEKGGGAAAVFGSF